MQRLISAHLNVLYIHIVFDIVYLLAPLVLFSKKHHTSSRQNPSPSFPYGKKLVIEESTGITTWPDLQPPNCFKLKVLFWSMYFLHYCNLNI